MNQAKRYFLLTTAAAVCSLSPGVYAEPSVDINAHTSTDTDTTLHHDKILRDTASDAHLREQNTGAHANVNINTDSNVRGDARTDRNTRHNMGVADINKATGLIGMEVKNPQGEKIGQIKDLVLDLNTGQVSYAVLAVGGFLGIGEKLIALPPSALQADPQDKKLVLNADKDKIVNATGFAATNWPEVGSKPWGAENYWNQPPNAVAPDYNNSNSIQTGRSINSQGSYNGDNVPAYQSEQPKVEKKTHWWNRRTKNADTSANYQSTDSRVNSSTRSQLDDAYRTDHGGSASANINTSSDNARLYNDSGKGASASVSANAGNGPAVQTGVNVHTDKGDYTRTANTIAGSIKTIDVENRTMTLTTDDGGTKSFRFTDRPNLTLGTRRNVLLSDLKPGYGVEVGYHEDGSGKLVADSVIKKGPTSGSRE